MIIILVPVAEKCVNNVLDWLIASEVSFMRITPEVPPSIEICIENSEIEYKINDLLESNISCFWVRKGYMTYATNLDSEETNIIAKTLLDYLSTEFDILSDYLLRQLESKKHLGNYFDRTPNKLHYLKFATEVGLTIPNTLVTSKKTTLVNFKLSKGELITKSIKDSFNVVNSKSHYYNNTERIADEHIESMPDSFFSTLVQENIRKKIELRIIFINQTLYSAAIFSQNNPKTQTDWRNQNLDKPNRIVPFKLPPIVVEKVQRFIKKSGLNIGAIDMIVTPEDDFVFLECNPNGQIGMVSESCNYFIESHIANFLKNEK